ncbi:amino acid-binding protein [Nocardiopsis sediminis]|uniref:Amino acid-binding protein n=1 Tax=Nocardiopsis sediminis TaxID=1778267 RepID=A0ABV8FP96_9ACTN
MGGYTHGTGPDTAADGTGVGRPGFLGREFLEIGTLLFAAGAAHLLVLALGHSDFGAPTLVGVGAALIIVSSFHRWRRHRTHTHAADPAESAGRADALRGAGRDAPADPFPRSAARHGPERLWRMRVGVSDVPGGLAALTAQLARLGVDIRLLHVHPGGGDEAIDEFYASVPSDVEAERLRAALVRAGGRDAVIEPADAHELSDTASRALSLAAGLIAGTATLPRSLLSLSGARDVEHHAAAPPGMTADELSGERMAVTSPEGGVLVLSRPGMPFTAVEFARCRALADVAGSLHSRLHPDRH